VITLVCCLALPFAFALVPVAGWMMEQSVKKTVRARLSPAPYTEEWVCYSSSIALYVLAGATGFAAFVVVLVVNLAGFKP